MAKIMIKTIRIKLNLICNRRATEYSLFRTTLTGCFLFFLLLCTPSNGFSQGKSIISQGQPSHNTKYDLDKLTFKDIRGSVLIDLYVLQSEKKVEIKDGYLSLLLYTIKNKDLVNMTKLLFTLS